MELRTAPFPDPEGQQKVSRTTWRWQRSTDGGTSWEDLWVIRYVRR